MTAKVPVHLLWGEDDFLLREEAMSLVGDARVHEVEAAAWRTGELADLATPSLFGERRALVITGARELGSQATSELAAYLSAPDQESSLIICCRVGERGKAPAALERIVKAVGKVRKVEIARKDLPTWILERAKARGMTLTPAAAHALTEVVGADPAQLAAALEQIADAYPERRIGPDEVHHQFRGLGEQKVWDLCDRAFAKDLAGAIRSLRAIEEGGDDPLMVVGGIASRLRDLIKVRALPERMSPAQLAQEAGLRFDWQARRYRQQAANFTMAALVGCQFKIADADRALKSGADGKIVMPVLIAAIAGN